MCAHFFLFKIENRIETIPLSSLEHFCVVYRPPSSQGKSRHFLTGERGAERGENSICIVVERLVGLLLHPLMMIWTVPFSYFSLTFDSPLSSFQSIKLQASS